jgi:hypothetical protein
MAAEFSALVPMGFSTKIGLPVAMIALMYSRWWTVSLQIT